MMLWVLLAGGAAVFYALHGAWSKRLASRVSPLVTAWAYFAFSLPILGAYLLARGVPAIAPGFWPAFLGNCAINLVASYVFVSAVRAGELGATMPLLGLTPLLVVPVELLLLGSAPGARGLGGIGLLAAGVYLLYFTGRHAGLLAPFRALAHDPGARRILVVVVLWSVSGVLDRVAVLNASPAFYAAALAGALTILFIPAILVRNSGLRSALRPAGPPALAVHGILFGLMFVLQMEALQLALAAYVISLKRTGALISVLIGWLAFKEGAVRSRLIGTTLILVGAFLVVVDSA